MGMDQHQMSEQQETNRNWKFNYWRKLSLLKDQTTQSREFIDSALIINIKQESTRDNLRKLMSSIKVQRLVKEFVFKLKRNTLHRASDNLETQLVKPKSLQYAFVDKEWRGFSVNNNLKILISFLTVICTVCVQVIATFQCFFEDFRTDSADEPGWMIVKFLCLVVSFAKILFGMSIVKHRNGVQLKYLIQIWLNYYQSKTWFLDFCLLTATILLIWSQLQIASIFSFFLSLICMIFVQNHMQLIEDYLIDNSTKRKYWDLSIVVLFNIYFSHVITSFLFAISFFDRSENWMIKYGIMDMDWYVKYCYGYYWATTIVSTTGFGDLTASNLNQAIILSFIMLFGCLVLSYNISQIGSILHNMREAANEVKHELATFKRLAKANHIDEKLQQSVARYIINSANIKSSFQFQERKKLLQKLPIEMREEFLEQASNAIFAKLPFFQLLENDTKVVVSEGLSVAVFSPGEYITSRKLGLTKLYILRQGELGFAYRKKGSTVNGLILQKRKVQSEFNASYLLNTYFLKLGSRINYNIIAETYCLVFESEFASLQANLRKRKKDYQFYRQLIDSADMDLHEWDKNECSQCLHNHTIFTCPQIHYMPYRSIIFLKQAKKAEKTQTRTILNFVKSRKGLIKIKTLKLWRKVLKHYETVLSVKDDKNYKKRQRKSEQEDNYRNKNIIEVLTEKFEENRERKDHELHVDVLWDFERYFVKWNPFKLNWLSLSGTKMNIQLQRMNSAGDM